ncbi:hypothetical protein DEU56DRAFT_851927 [Suillus clintonianus]|uniref:uncharacterized protein n=1 Tax=Suillus clintonianus TaxID=1904413 RepID=UPI001B866DE3|nr:uncharacterized protein DEU56DRAFT_851927 [Suillus clintonianus]KAG2148893.1 hypothetical protein DEU56DRAFT_851927 [Suillus clintonianus]
MTLAHGKEGHSLPLAPEMFKTNFRGATNVSRAAVKFFREVNELGKGGSAFQMSSTNVIGPFPGLGYYAATCCTALQGFLDCLAKELLPSWNTKRDLHHRTWRFPNKYYGHGGDPAVSSIHRIVVYDFCVVSHRRWCGVQQHSVQSQRCRKDRADKQIVLGGNFDIQRSVPIGLESLDTIETLTAKIESLKVTLAETAPWSANLN